MEFSAIDQTKSPSPVRAKKSNWMYQWTPVNRF